MQLSELGVVERTKMQRLRNGSKGDSNPGSLDCESGILPVRYRASQVNIYIATGLVLAGVSRSTLYTNNHVYIALMYIVYVGQINKILILIQIHMISCNFIVFVSDVESWLNEKQKV